MSHGQYLAAPISGAKLEEIAASLRVVFEVDKEPYFPIAKILEKTLPTIDPGYVFDVWTTEEMDHDEGRTYPDKKLLILREDVYEGMLAGKARDRFTAAHELGHLVLHEERFLSRRPEQGNIKPYLCPEWQANRLAAALLMPAAEMKTCTSVGEACTRFGVSSAAAMKRSRDLGRTFTRLI